MPLDLHLTSVSLLSLAGSRWGHVRSRALSYPVSSPGSTLQAMLQLPRTQTLEEEGGEREGASGGASETKSKVRMYIYIYVGFKFLLILCVRQGSDGEPSAVVKCEQFYYINHVHYHL